MGDDKLPPTGAEAPDGDPAGASEDLLRRAAQALRASPASAAMTPLTPDERAELADAAIAQALDAAAPPASVGAADVVPLPLGRRPARARVWAIAGAALAAAAAVVLLLRGGGAPPLARYAMTVEGERDVRGEPAASAPAPVRVRPTTRLRVALAASAPERDTLVRLLVVARGRATVIDPPITRDRAGLTIEGVASELLGPQVDGPAELVAVLGRSMPADRELEALALPGARDPPALQVLRRAVVLEGFAHTAVEVLLGGCRAVVVPADAPPRCELAAGAELHLWVGTEPGAIAVALDGRPLPLAGQPRRGGAAIDLGELPRAGALSILVGGRAIAAWTLAPAAVSPRIEAAARARLAGRLDEAEAALAEDDAGSAEERLEAARWHAKIALRRGDPVAERTWRERAIAQARELGRVSAELDETVALMFSLRGDHELSRALQLLPTLDAHPHARHYAEAAVRRDQVRGLLASDLGDLGAALAAFQRALATAEQIADGADRAAILGPLADVLQALGREGEVRALVDAELARGAREVDPCARVDALTNAGWLLRAAAPARALALAAQSAELARSGCRYRLALALLNHAWVLATGGKLADARAVAAQIASAPGADDGLVATWALRLEAELMLGEAPARALRHAPALAARAAALCSTELAYEAALLEARALVALARPTEAAHALAAAERVLALWSRLVPLGEGRATFFQRHDELARTAVPFLLAQARAGAAGAGPALAATIRRSIARFAASVAGGGHARARAQRGDGARGDTSRGFEQTFARWPAHLDPTAPAGEAIAGVCEARDAAARAEPSPITDEPPPDAALLLHPVPRGLVVVAWRGAAVEIRELPAAGLDEAPDALAERIALAAAPLLAGAPRVQLHVHRSLVRAPIDRSLAHRLGAPVAFAVDAPPPRPAAACAGPRRALVVTNPQQNLWSASATGPEVQRGLEQLGLTVDRLDGAAATLPAVTARLTDPCTAVFHYDGHGRAGAADRAADALLLAGGDALSAAEVLDLPRVPAEVVLNGCTTAAPEGLGLAQAFVLAGAAQVVASIDPIADAAATRFARALFAAPPGTADRAPAPRALDLVQRFAQASGAVDDPAALRVFTR